MNQPPPDSDGCNIAGPALDRARCSALLTRFDLWIRYFGLGGTSSLDQVHGYLTGGPVLDRTQHNTLVQAINEQHLDHGQNHPVPYLD